MARRKKNKEWFKSKTVWFNVVMTLILFLPEVGNTFPKISELTTLTTLFGNLILRVWFTKESIR